MIDREHGLAVTQQAEALEISRGSVYYLPRAVPPRDLILMRRMDELHMDYPFAGARMLCGLLNNEGLGVGRKHVGTLMKKMGIAALYRRPKTSKPESGHKIYPYLLRQVKVERPNQAWAMDISYIPMAKGFVYLAAVIDWFTRQVLAWRVSITMETAFCVEAPEEALEKYQAPDIFNTDQGSQFTSEAFTSVLSKRGISISMDGKGAWRDNVFVERLWRSVKYEEVYLKAYASVAEARDGLARYFIFYNTRRPHQSLDGRTEPPRDCRRHFCLSYAAMAGMSNMA
jgi:putative transposase